MSNPVIKGFPTDQGTALYDFSALANVPEPLKEMPAATVGQYLVVEEVDTEGKIKKVKTVAGPDSTQNVYVLADGETIDDAPADAAVVIDPNGEADVYSKTEIDNMFGSYITEVAALVGGDA